MDFDPRNYSVLSLIESLGSPTNRSCMYFILNTGTDAIAPTQAPIQYTIICSTFVCPEQPHFNAVAKTGLK